jgi:hypothetical protein
MRALLLVVLGALALVMAPPAAVAQQASAQPKMGFFVTSVGLGRGANLGGLQGADAHCQKLASAAGAGDRKWQAYLSQIGSGGQPNYNARDRIGAGPWYNAKGVLIAQNVDALHSDKNNLNKTTALTERGEVVNGRGDTPNRHDILTGADAKGMIIPGNYINTTCGNWVRWFGEGAAMVGHHDREGGGENGTSWNAAHPTKGCGQADLEATGGAGLFYCFAVN